ncbi:hypothetical protein [Streptomyces tsukubensis]|nr:hypothetical protein [Streptomyces tsukubensis]QFR97344.1 hypothetical protein GBW32_35100 [Streptomyces tsukubensis]
MPPATTTGPWSLRAVPRPAASGTDPVSYAVRQLAAGPTAAESDVLTTALPALKHPSRITVESDRHSDTVVVRFPVGTDRLPGPALQQLTCTAARARRVELSTADRTPAKRSAAPAPITEPTARTRVELRVTDRQAGSDGRKGDGWEVTVTDEACPS